MFARSLADIELKPGVRMFRSYVFLGGILPIDFSDMTLIDLTPGVGFVEESPMGSMKRWQHARRIETREDGVALVDELTFEPRVASRLVGAFIERVFRHRHEVLRAHLG